MPERPASFGRPHKFQLGRAGVDFSSLDGWTVAVILERGGERTVFRGTAIFQRDDALGNILRVTPNQPELGDPQLILAEQSWKGRIIPDLQYGCQFCMIPSDPPGR